MRRTKVNIKVGVIQLTLNDNYSHKHKYLNIFCHRSSACHLTTLIPARNACNNSGAEERKTCNPRPLRHSDVILDIYTYNTESSFK